MITYINVQSCVVTALRRRFLGYFVHFSSCCCPNCGLPGERDTPIYRTLCCCELNLFLLLGLGLTFPFGVEAEQRFTPSTCLARELLNGRICSFLEPGAQTWLHKSLRIPRVVPSIRHQVPADGQGKPVTWWAQVCSLIFSMASLLCYSQPQRIISLLRHSFHTYLVLIIAPFWGDLPLHIQLTSTTSHTILLSRDIQSFPERMSSLHPVSKEHIQQTRSQSPAEQMLLSANSTIQSEKGRKQVRFESDREAYLRRKQERLPNQRVPSMPCYLGGLFGSGGSRRRKMDSDDSGSLSDIGSDSEESGSSDQGCPALYTTLAHGQRGARNARPFEDEVKDVKPVEPPSPSPALHPSLSTVEVSWILFAMNNHGVVYLF